MKKKHKRSEIFWRKEILRRDNYTCRMCGVKPIICETCGRGQSLTTHHILPIRYFPKYKYNINNGITLCYKCHSKIPKNISKVLDKIKVDLILQNG